MIPKKPALGLDPRVGTGFRKRPCARNMRKEKAMTMPISRVLLAACVITATALAPVSAPAAEKLDKLVTVTGEATIAATPDAALIRLGVSSQSKTARAASDANAKEIA